MISEIMFKSLGWVLLILLLLFFSGLIAGGFIVFQMHGVTCLALLFASYLLSVGGSGIYVLACRVREGLLAFSPSIFVGEIVQAGFDGVQLGVILACLAFYGVMIPSGLALTLVIYFPWVFACLVALVVLGWMYWNFTYSVNFAALFKRDNPGQISPDNHLIQTDTAKLDAVAQRAAQARAVPLNIPPLKTKKENRNVYSG